MSKETSALDSYLGRTSAPEEQTQQVTQTQEVQTQSPQGESNVDDSDNDVQEQVQQQAPAAVETPTAETEEEIIFEDDATDTEAVQTQAHPNEVYSTLSKELGFEIKDPTAIKAKLEEYKTQLEQAPKFANDRIKELNEFALKGGKVADIEKIDSELQAIDSHIQNITQADPIEAWKLHHKEDIGLTDDEVETLLESKGEVVAKVEGKTLIKQWETNLLNQKQTKQGERAKMRDAQEAKYAALTNGIKDSLAKKTSLYSVKLSENDIAKVSKLAETPLRAIEQFFPYDEQGNPVVEVWAENFAKLTLGDSKANTLFKKAKSDGGRQVIAARSNGQLQRNPTAMNGSQTVSREQNAANAYLKTF